MEENKMKNIVVLKNLPSNLVEEAIVVLKQNKIKLPEYVEKRTDTNITKAKSKEYILKEAEMIVSNYLSKIENNNKISKKKNENGIHKKYKRLQWITFGILVAWTITIFF